MMIMNSIQTHTTGLHIGKKDTENPKQNCVQVGDENGVQDRFEERID